MSTPKQHIYLQYVLLLETANRDAFPAWRTEYIHGRLHKVSPPFVLSGHQHHAWKWRGRSAVACILVRVSLEMGVKLVLLLLQARGHDLVDVLEQAVHGWLSLAFRCFEGLRHAGGFATQNINKRGQDKVGL